MENLILWLKNGRGGIWKPKPPAFFNLDVKLHQEQNKKNLLMSGMLSPEFPVPR